jgi:MFS family permease
VTQEPEPSYRALFDVPNLPRILLSMAFSRVAGAMLSIAIVLFTLTHYGSPELAGLVTFVSIMPGLLVSPVGGALLDRHGRVRLVVIGYLVGAASLVLIGGLAQIDALPAWLLVVISGIASLTGPLSNTGLRSMFPIMVPPRLWSRVNAIDSNGYLAATLIGPPIAAAMVQFIGGPITLVLIGALFAISSFVLAGTPEPAGLAPPTAGLLHDSVAGLLYTWRNRTIRGLGLVMFALNLGGGVLTLVIPIVALNRLHESPGFVGAAWALAGAFGIVTGLWFGRLDSRGRERGWMIWSTFGSALAVAVLLVEVSVPSVLLCMAITGICNGPLDIGLFTLRQRRTDPAWMGRAIAVSASLNFSGFPIGSAISGALVERSLELTIAFGVVACLVSTFFAVTQIPAEEPVAEAAAA